MDINTALLAISPLDGRYKSKVEAYELYFSEFALIKYRVKVEILYFVALARQIPQLTAFPTHLFDELKKIAENFDLEDAIEIKEVEKTTNHDVKAVEYFVKKKFDELGVSEFKEFIHFGLTSQDINNTSVPLLLKESINQELLPSLEKLLENLEGLVEQNKDIALLARTHGQPASPTRLGKEIQVFVERLKCQLKLFHQIPYSAKFGGATGNFNAHHVAFPEIDWKEFGDKFVSDSLGLKRSHPTTQIEHYDNLAAHFDALRRMSTVLIDLCRDFWTYISMNYFSQKVIAGEIGSSAMPHKVNPIDFENAEGNLGIANALFSHLSEKLPISRLQRDLTDSTVLRNIGVPISHMALAISSLQKGLSKVQTNEQVIMADLEDNWAVVAEALQTILRREQYPNPYEVLKDLTRGNQRITQSSIHDFIKSLGVSDSIKEEMLKITPWNYTGI